MFRLFEGETADDVWLNIGSAFQNGHDVLVQHSRAGNTREILHGIDQLERAYHALIGKPHTRQVVLQIWEPKVDLPRLSGDESAADVPCNIVSMLKVRNGKLEWTQILRSNDVRFWGSAEDKWH